MKPKLFTMGTIFTLCLGTILSILWGYYGAGILFFLTLCGFFFILFGILQEPSQYRLYKETNGIRNYYGYIPTTRTKIHNQWVSVKQYAYLYCKADSKAICGLLNCEMEKV